MLVYEWHKCVTRKDYVHPFYVTVSMLPSIQVVDVEQFSLWADPSRKGYPKWPSVIGSHLLSPGISLTRLPRFLENVVSRTDHIVYTKLNLFIGSTYASS